MEVRPSESIQPADEVARHAERNRVQAANGSSYMISIGSSAIARARATRRAMPPDSSAGMSLRAPRKPTACSFISTRSRITFRRKVGVLAHLESHVVKHRHVGEQRPELEQHAHLAPQAWKHRRIKARASCPGTVYLPDLARSEPAMISAAWTSAVARPPHERRRRCRRNAQLTFESNCCMASELNRNLVHVDDGSGGDGTSGCGEWKWGL